MKEKFPMTYKTGSIGDFMRWTKQVVTDPVAAKDTPKRWFDSDETATKSLGTSAAVCLAPGDGTKEQ